MPRGLMLPPDVPERPDELAGLPIPERTGFGREQTRHSCQQGVGDEGVAPGVLLEPVQGEPVGQRMERRSVLFVSERAHHFLVECLGRASFRHRLGHPLGLEPETFLPGRLE